MVMTYSHSTFHYFFIYGICDIYAVDMFVGDNPKYTNHGVSSTEHSETYVLSKQHYCAVNIVWHLKKCKPH